MSNFKIPPADAERIAETHAPEDVEGFVRLAEIISGAFRDPTIAKCQSALDRVESFYSTIVIDYEHEAMLRHREDNHSAALDRLATKLKSRVYSNSAKSSQQPRIKAKAFCLEEFMTHDGQWDSIAHAVRLLKENVMSFSKVDGRRPLAPTNVDRQIREWISELIHQSDEAFYKLSEQGRCRVRR